MLKLVSAYDVKFDSVKEYYDSFKNKSDIYCYEICMINKGEDEYIKHLDWNKTEFLYYLVDDENPNYIYGFGSINDSRIINYNELNIGHIGYGVRNNERNKGYGTIILSLLLKECEELGMKKVSVSCHKDNYASEQIILKNGGVFDKKFVDELEGDGKKYWITLKPKLTNRVKRLLNK